MTSDEPVTLQLRFEDLSLGDAGIRAAQLRQELMNLSPDVSVKLERENLLNMDAGSILQIALEGPAMLALAGGLARAIAVFLGRTGTRVSISANGTIVAENVSGKDLPKIIDAVSKRK